MYKFNLVLLCAIAFAYVVARPAEDIPLDSPTTTTTPATILKQIEVNNPDGSFNNSFETSNGIKVENIGYMKRIIIPRSESADGKIVDEHEELILVQTGSYSYTDPDGHIITLRYIADENGFQPEGDHLPVPVQ